MKGDLARLPVPAGRAKHPLRGRSAELGLALEALRSTVRGRPAFVVMRGEPGIGKTAMVQAVVEQALRTGFVVAEGVAHEDDKVTPLGSLGPALRVGVDPLTSSADFVEIVRLAEQPLWLAERLATLLEDKAAAKPILITLDDAQWSDPLTTFVLRILPMRLMSSPIMWLLATREAPGGPVDHISESVEPVVPVVRIDLPPLTHGAVLEVAVDRLGEDAGHALAEQLASTRGSPFLAVQLLEGLFEPRTSQPGAGGLSTGLQEGVRRRLVATSRGCRELLRAAAVLGTTFLLNDVAILLDTAPAQLTDPLIEAIAVGVLDDHGTGVSFRHDLLREAIYQDIPPSGRRAMHQAITEHFLASDRGCAAAAPHVLATAAPGDAAAVDVLRKAAHEISGTMAATSVAFILGAFDLTAEDDPEWAQIGSEVVAILTLARRHLEARRFADTIICRSVPADLVAHIQLLLFPRLWAAGELVELNERANDARASGAGTGLGARLAAYRAFAEGPAVVALEVAERSNDLTATVVALTALAEEAERGGHYVMAHEQYHRAWSLAGDAGGAAGCPASGHLEVRLLMARAQLGDIDDVLASVPEALRQDGGTTDSWQAPQLAWLRACLALGAGRIDDAAGDADLALRLMDDVEDKAFESPIRYVLANVALLRGDLDEARGHLVEVRRLGESLPMLGALIAVAEGDPSAAAVIVELASTSRLPWRDELLLHAACTAQRSGDEATLRAAADALETLATNNPGVVCVAGAGMVALGLITGDLGPAVAALGAASRPLLLARAEEEYGRVTLALGDRQDAVAALDRARDRYSASGASAAATRVQRILQSAGVRRRRWSPVPQRPVTGWESLTVMERRVALLVAGGHTNRSAADELVLSASTISTHLRSVFRKLDVHTRVQLARVALHAPTDRTGPTGVVPPIRPDTPEPEG